MLLSVVHILSVASIAAANSALADVLERELRGLSAEREKLASADASDEPAYDEHEQRAQDHGDHDEDQGRDHGQEAATEPPTTPKPTTKQASSKRPRPTKSKPAMLLSFIGGLNVLKAKDRMFSTMSPGSNRSSKISPHSSGHHSYKHSKEEQQNKPDDTTSPSPSIRVTPFKAKRASKSHGKTATTTTPPAATTFFPQPMVVIGANFSNAHNDSDDPPIRVETLQTVMMSPQAKSGPGGPCSVDQNCDEIGAKCVMIPVYFPGVLSLKSCQCVSPTIRAFNVTEGRFTCVELEAAMADHGRD